MADRQRQVRHGGANLRRDGLHKLTTRLAREQLLTALDSRVIGTFEVDELYDYRSRRPTMLFGGYYSDYSYDVARDGQHFLMIKPAIRPERQPNDQVIIIFNWFSELQQRVP